MREQYYEIIRYPVVTEKATILAENNNKYVFKVAISANKEQIKKAIEAIFSVDVVKVNTINMAGKVKIFRGRRGKRNDFKKAIVQVKPDQKIDLSLGVM